MEHITPTIVSVDAERRRQSVLQSVVRWLRSRSKVTILPLSNEALNAPLATGERRIILNGRVMVIRAPKG